MKRIVILAGLLFSTAAIAADLPSRTAPMPPQRPVFTEPTNPFFVGVHVGATFSNDNYRIGDDQNYNINVRGGWEFSPYARLEANYDYSYNTYSPFTTNTVTGNLIGQYRFGSVVPYVLAGVGYRWSGFSDQFVYNFGGGVRYEITRQVEADLRYRYIADNDNRYNQNVVTLGLNYKF